jgi:agmatinase
LRSPVVGPGDPIDADLVIVGAPTDEGSFFMPGLRFVAGEPGYFDPSAGRHFLQREMSQGRIVDMGDADIVPTNVSGTFDNITAWKTLRVNPPGSGP